MSREKEMYEARRWLDTALEDLDAARALLDKQKFSHACFFAQQAAEKSLKSLWISMGEDPWGHSIQKLITEFPNSGIKTTMEEYIETSAILDRYYIPTRYPNGLPDLTPGKYYFQKDADLCIESAERILKKVREILG
ncbi:MAG: HEPN domain-containing protein [Syntrophaceae bacterium]